MYFELLARLFIFGVGQLVCHWGTYCDTALVCHFKETTVNLEIPTTTSKYEKKKKKKKKKPSKL